MRKFQKSIFIELTNTCNLSCSYCNKHYGKDSIDVGLFEKIIQQATIEYRDDIRLICLWGGEPLLHPKFDEILNISGKYLSKIHRKFNFVINTNGLLLSKGQEVLIKLFSSVPNISFIVYVSLDGLGSDGNQERKINNIAYQKIEESIKLFKESINNLQNVEIIISAVLPLKSIPIEELNNFTLFYKNLDIPINFCLQEIVAGKTVDIELSDIKNLFERMIFLKKHGYNVVIESIEDMNSLLRINVLGDIYNFIDEAFEGSKYFIISRNGNLGFLDHEDWHMNRTNAEIWKIIYVYPLYIKFISRVYHYFSKHNL